MNQIRQARTQDKLHAKAERSDLTGSVKDRGIFNIVQEAKRDGPLRPGKAILDAPSGNAGVSYVTTGAWEGYQSP